LTQFLIQKIKDIYLDKENLIGPDNLRRLEKAVLLSVVDSKWKEHLYAMDNLREGIGLRQYAERDPIIEYKHEGAAMFDAMIESIKEEVTGYLFKIEPLPEINERRVFSLSGRSFIHPEATPMGRIPQRRARMTEETSGQVPAGMPASHETKRSPEPSAPYQRQVQKTGRNEPCPCGSGKKYKKCCGKG
jgi:preprotein translocase subunit SecA